MLADPGVGLIWELACYWLPDLSILVDPKALSCEREPGPRAVGVSCITTCLVVAVWVTVTAGLAWSAVDDYWPVGGFYSVILVYDDVARFMLVEAS
jgi:hypothetical protein